MNKKTGIEKLRMIEECYSAGQGFITRDSIGNAIANQIEREQLAALNEKIETICTLNRQVDNLTTKVEKLNAQLAAKTPETGWSSVEELEEQLNRKDAVPSKTSQARTLSRLVVELHLHVPDLTDAKTMGGAR